MRNISGIPIIDSPPKWQSSSPTPIYHLESIHPFVKEFRDYNYDPELANLLNGKTIAYVAPSPHLKGLGMGDYIDSHDLVIRINQACDAPEVDWKDYGRRTDISVNCLNILKRTALEKNMDFANSLKFMICPMINMTETADVNNFLERLEAPTHNVCDGYLLKLFEQVGTICNTGLAGIVTLLNYEIENIYVTGMTFYNMNTFGKVYSDSYHDEAAKNNNFSANIKRQPSPEELRMDIHYQQPQINYFAKMLKHHYPTKLRVDDYLIENFNLKS